MLERFKNLFSNIKFRRHKSDKAAISAKKAVENTGTLYKIWLLALPMLVGASAGRLASVGVGYGLDAIANNNGVLDVAVTGAQVSAAETEKKRGLDGFLTANPFKISPEKAEAPEPVVSKDPEPPKEPDTGLADLILRGTLPGVGAWVENKGVTTLLLVGKNIEEYKLMSVQYSDALFRKGKKTVKKYITYGPIAQAKKEEAPKPAPAATPAPTPQPANTGNVVAADPSGKEGEVSSETVQQLVQNPFDELKRIRIRPSESAGGLEVQWIQNDSILKRLGVQKGDVIRSVNGIPFTNMGDIANSINSLMNSERFDVEVTRGGKPAALRYVVR